MEGGRRHAVVGEVNLQPVVGLPGDARDAERDRQGGQRRPGVREGVAVAAGDRPSHRVGKGDVLWDRRRLAAGEGEHLDHVLGGRHAGDRPILAEPPRDRPGQPAVQVDGRTRHAGQRATGQVEEGLRPGDVHQDDVRPQEDVVLKDAEHLDVEGHGGLALEHGETGAGHPGLDLSRRDEVGRGRAGDRGRRRGGGQTRRQDRERERDDERRAADTAGTYGTHAEHVVHPSRPWTLGGHPTPPTPVRRFRFRPRLCSVPRCGSSRSPPPWWRSSSPRCSAGGTSAASGRTSPCGRPRWRCTPWPRSWSSSVP